MSASVLVPGVYCPIKRYATYTGASVTSAANTCATSDAINAQIIARIAQLGDSDCRSFDCAFDLGGGSVVTLGANGATGDLLSFLLSASSTRTTTLAPGTQYTAVIAKVSFTFTLPD